MSNEANTPLSPVVFLSHGGGPLPLLGDAGHQHLLSFFKEIAPTLGKPAAIVVVSAHWEERLPTITSGVAPALIYDYYGFPKESYAIQYPAPGSPALADRLLHLLKKDGIAAKLDDQRGFDHGLFVPLKLLFPMPPFPVCNYPWSIVCSPNCISR